MTANLPDLAQDYLNVFVRSFRDCFGEKLLGIYLHGSLAMGCFNPPSSDIDILVVTTGKLSINEKQGISQILHSLSETTPASGLEMSIVTLASLRNFQHPTPYELHFSNHNKDAFASGQIDFTREATDADLAAHFVVTRARGLCLYGEAIAAVFPDIPRDAYLDSIVGDTDESYGNIMRGPDEGQCRVPMYGVLNFCRVLAFIQEGLITSKLEGGQWGLEHLPTPYHPVIHEALAEYTAPGNAQTVNARLLKEFAGFANAAIHQEDR